MGSHNVSPREKSLAGVAPSLPLKGEMVEYIDEQKFKWDCATVAVMNALIYKGHKPNYRRLRAMLGTNSTGTEDSSIFLTLIDLGFNVTIGLDRKHDYKGPALLSYNDDDGDAHIAFFNGKKGYNTFLESGKPKELYYVVRL